MWVWVCVWVCMAFCSPADTSSFYTSIYYRQKRTLTLLVSGVQHPRVCAMCVYNTWSTGRSKPPEWIMCLKGAKGIYILQWAHTKIETYDVFAGVDANEGMGRTHSNGIHAAQMGMWAIGEIPFIFEKPKQQSTTANSIKGWAERVML